MLDVFLFGPALIVFLVPCFLPGRWLAVYCVLTLLGLIYLWRDDLAHQDQGNGAATVLGLMALLAATVAAGAGVTVGAARVAARYPQSAWRYAWVPMLITAGILWDVTHP